MRHILSCLTAALLFCGAQTNASAQERRLELTMQDGRVTIVARDVPLRDVLQEWSRVGQTKIVNADKVVGPPLTLQLVNTSERDALDILLRSVAGYLAVPRPAGDPGVSVYDRIAILASSRAPAAVAPTPIAYVAPPTHGDMADDPVDAPVLGSAGAQPPPVSQQENVAPLPGLQPQLEGAQPRGLDLRTLMRAQQQAAPPATAAQPGIVPNSTPGRYPAPNPYQVPKGGGGE